jgi:hypothetical protein
MANWFNKKCETFLEGVFKYRRDVKFVFWLLFILLFLAGLIKKNWDNMPDSFWIKICIGLIIQFFQLWGTQQWIWSVGVLVMSYSAFLNRIFNQICLKYTGKPWLTLRQRMYVIALDLTVNVIIGMLVLHYIPCSGLAIFLHQCPIALSPVIFAGEVIVLYVYCYLNRQK